MRIHNALRKDADQIMVRLQRVVHGRGETTPKMVLPQLSQCWCCTRWAIQNFRWAIQLPEPISLQMPERVMPGVGRTIRPELFQQDFQQWLGIVPIHRLRSNVVHAGQRQQHQKRFVHCPPIAVLPNANCVER